MARKRFAIVVGLVLSLGLVGTVLAEGFFQSSIAGGRVGFQSRRWTDNHRDNHSTKVIFEGCRDSVAANDPADNVDVHLWRDISFAPDDDFGAKRLNCWVSGTGNWGEMVKVGNYYFQIDAITGVAGTSVNVPVVKVHY